MQKSCHRGGEEGGPSVTIVVRVFTVHLVSVSQALSHLIAGNLGGELKFAVWRSTINRQIKFRQYYFAFLNDALYIASWLSPYTCHCGAGDRACDREKKPLEVVVMHDSSAKKE